MVIFGGPPGPAGPGQVWDREAQLRDLGSSGLPPREVERLLDYYTITGDRRRMLLDRACGVRQGDALGLRSSTRAWPSRLSRRCSATPT
jgi:hypothetical protein